MWADGLPSQSLEQRLPGLQGQVRGELRCQGRQRASHNREGWGLWGLRAGWGDLEETALLQGQRGGSSAVLRVPCCWPGLTHDLPACLFIPGSIVEAAANSSVPATLCLTGLRACLGGPAPGRCGFPLWTIVAFKIDVCKDM